MPHYALPSRNLIAHIGNEAGQFAARASKAHSQFVEQADTTKKLIADSRELMARVDEVIARW